MILIVVKWPIKPDKADEFMSLADEFTQAVRAEPGNLFFDWSRSVDDPNEYVLVEGFRDADAGAEHVNADHFKKAVGWLPDVVSGHPKIINADIPSEDFGEMAEVAPR